ncbi:MAG: YbaK/EbsC family protein [Chloroflexota bacterium]|nr:YbaK/EbsC family protein [Chloroflexota bacterium]
MRAHAAAARIDLPITRFPAATRTATDAAREIGCGVEEIVKSLVFRAGDEMVVALCSGADRVDEARLASAIGASSVRRATAGEAKSATGYPIGGVPPFGHATPLRVVADRRLLDFDRVWAAAGLPDAVFPIAPADLVRLGSASIADVAVIAPVA